MLGSEKKSLPSPRLELTAQGVAYRCSKVECEDHSAIQATSNIAELHTTLKFALELAPGSNPSDAKGFSFKEDGRQ